MVCSIKIFMMLCRGGEKYSVTVYESMYVIMYVEMWQDTNFDGSLRFVRFKFKKYCTI